MLHRSSCLLHQRSGQCSVATRPARALVPACSNHTRRAVACQASSRVRDADVQQLDQSALSTLLRPSAAAAAAGLCIEACLSGGTSLLIKVVCGATAAAAAAAEITLQQAQGNAARAAASMQQPDAEESTEATITSTSSSSATEQEAGGSDTSSSSSLMQALQAAPQLLRQPGVPAMAAALVCAAGVAAMLPAQDLPAMSSLTLVAYLLCAAPQVLSISRSLEAAAEEQRRLMMESAIKEAIHDAAIHHMRQQFEIMQDLAEEAVRDTAKQLKGVKKQAAQQLKETEKQAAQQLKAVKQQAAQQQLEVQQAADKQIAAAKKAALQEVVSAKQQAQQALAADRQRVAEQQAQLAQQEKETKRLLRKAEEEAGLVEELRQKLESQGSRIQSLQQTIEQQQRQLKQLNKLEARLESTKEQLAQQQAQREALNAQLLLVKHEAAQAQEQLAAVQAADLRDAQQAGTATPHGAAISSNSSGNDAAGQAAGGVPVDAAAEATSQKRVVAFVGGRRMKDSDKKLIPDADNAEIRHFGGTKDVGIGDIKRLEVAIKAGKIDEVYMLIRWNGHVTTNNVSRWCKERDIPCHLVAPSDMARRKAEVAASSSDDEGAAFAAASSGQAEAA